ncbi:hypothetical protein ACQCN2_14665 [Brevibacillus ginsengisoli]|uniref:hypothetical protein n=1 Tax=Brevibacillus ginsengisoli TaxID=363854 RepID=UPI003CFB1474
MIDIGGVSVDWRTMLYQMSMFFIPILVVIGLLIMISKRSNRTQELEERIKELEAEIKRLKQE